MKIVGGNVIASFNRQNSTGGRPTNKTPAADAAAAVLLFRINLILILISTEFALSNLISFYYVGTGGGTPCIRMFHNLNAKF
jgi:hypothetical protein